MEIKQENCGKKPFISIIVPAYKTEKYLEQCLDSIINQTLENIEIIVVDEGDMDECRSIIDRYEFGDKKDSRIKTIHEKNGGYGASVNKGIALASGDYIGIVEADDFIDKNMYRDLLDIANKNSADIVKSDFYYYTASKNQSRKSGKIPKALAGKVISIKDAPELLKIQPSIWSAIYRRDFLNKNNIRFLETKGGSYQDTSFTFKVFSMAERIVLTTNPYLYYRTDNETSSVHSKGKVFAISDEYDEITRFLNANPNVKKYANDLKLINQYNAYIWNLKRIDKDFRKEFISKFKEDFITSEKAGEFSKAFYKKINKKELQLLLNSPDLFEKYIDNLADRYEKKLQRRTLHSIRINSSRISVVLFGKQIIERSF